MFKCSMCEDPMPISWNRCEKCDPIFVKENQARYERKKRKAIKEAKLARAKLGQYEKCENPLLHALYKEERSYIRDGRLFCPSVLYRIIKEDLSKQV